MFLSKLTDKAQKFVAEKTTANVKSEIKTQAVESIPIFASIGVAIIIFAALHKTSAKAAASIAPSTITIINNNFYNSSREFGNDISSLTETICEIANKMVETSVKKGV